MDDDFLFREEKRLPFTESSPSHGPLKQHGSVGWMSLTVTQATKSCPRSKNMMSECPTKIYTANILNISWENIDHQPTKQPKLVNSLSFHCVRSRNNEFINHVVHIWGFPEMGVPLVIRFSGISRINHPFFWLPRWRAGNLPQHPDSLLPKSTSTPMYLGGKG